jgi:ANTAR domain
LLDVAIRPIPVGIPGRNIDHPGNHDPHVVPRHGSGAGEGHLMVESAGASGLAAEFLHLHEFLRTGADARSALQRLVDLAVAWVPGCQWSAITAWPAHDRPRSLAYSSDVALTADHVQYALGEGPCLAAAAAQDVVHIADLDRDDRWPRFRAAVRRRTPVRGVLTIRLPQQPQRNALNLYSDRPTAYDAEAVATAVLFATHAGALLLHAESSDEARHLDRALRTNRQIGTAIGILMAVHKITDEDAFVLLRTTSQRLNRKLYLVADDVNRTGTLPA